MAVNYDPRYLTYDKDEVQRILAKAAESAPQSTTYTKEEVDELVGVKYQKPESGIPKTDLATDVQASLTKADNHEFQFDTLPTKGDVNKVEYIVPSQASRSQQVTSNSLEQTNVIGYEGHNAYRYPTGISVPAGCAVRIAASRKCMWLTNAAGMYTLDRFGDFYVNQTQNTKTVYVAVAPTAGDLTLYYYDTPLVTVQEQLAQKQDPIADLDTIRTGAAAGATAYQKPAAGIPANDLSSDVQASLNKAEAAAPQADTYTKAEVDEAIADMSEQLNDVAFLGDVEGSATADFDPVADTLHKGAQVLSASEQEQVRTNINAQEKLVSGQNIATINGSRIDQGGNVIIVAAEGQTITIDAVPTAGSENAVSSGGVANLTEGMSVLTENNLTVYSDNNYLNYQGKVTSSTSGKIFSYSARKGDYIHVYSDGSSGMTIIGKDSGKANAESLVLGGRTDKSYNYICLEDATIYIGIVKNATYRVIVVRNEQYTALLSSEREGYIDITQLASTIGSKYIRFSDGAPMTAGSYFYVKTINVAGISRVKAYVTAADNIPAAIAFYSSDVISANSYISGVQMNSNLGGGRWYEADVPTNAVLMAITNHHSYCATPQILASNLTNTLTGVNRLMESVGIGIVFGYKKADNYSGTFEPFYSLNSYFPQEDFQLRIRNTALYGIRVNVKKVGALTIVKATGVKTDNCVTTTIKAFNIALTGWQVLLFDSPVMLSSTESIGIGISTDTATLVADSVSSNDNVKLDYLHYTQNNWVVYNGNLLIDVLGVPKNEAGEALVRIGSLERTNAFAGANPFRFGGPFYAHLFLDKIYEESTNIIIPSESLHDVRVSARLGYKVIEANVHTTSDGQFVVIHGISGTFGYEVTDLNGEFTYADTVISSVTLDWIKTNLRYRSDVPRYRTQIPTLEEFLTECKANGMIPFCQANTAAIVSLLDGIMGYGNYIAYNGTRALTNAPIAEYLSLTTKADILARARSFGVPYIYEMSNMQAFTDAQLKEIVRELHAEGFMVGTAYGSPTSTNRALAAGFDLIAAGHQVNDFEANVDTWSSGVNWDEFTTTGTITDAGLTLEQGQRLDIATQPSKFFLSKALLRITFTGTLRVFLGEEDTAGITSDGSKSMLLSSYVLNKIPTLVILGTPTGATITDIVYKVSKC